MKEGSRGGLVPAAGEPGRAPQSPRLRLDEPVIVLTCGRSGSTLLRLILDAHPVLACPPETGVVNMCAQLGMLSITLEGPASGGAPGLGELGRASIRSWVTANFGGYLMRAGKSRWCDKSVGSAESAGRFLDLFPKAKFICLYRHCMDVIDSALEACPWGLRGFGLEPYAAAHPGNSVAAVADFWVTQTRTIATFEQAYPDACLRVRYEDLVADPEGQAERIFTFLGEEQIPDVVRSCFAAERQAIDPADYKIWTTTGVRPDSVGRGCRIPAHTISPAVLALVNDLLGRLEYEQVDERWNVLDENWPQRTPLTAAMGGQVPGSSSDGVRVPPDASLVFDGLELLLTSRVAGSAAAAGNPTAGAEPAPAAFTVTAALPQGAAGPGLRRTWQVSMAQASVSRAEALAAGGKTGEGGAWCVEGAAATWISVLSGQLNLGVAIRHGYLRYTSGWNGDDSLPAPLRTDARTRCLTQWLTPASN